ncbi:MAG: hypothetical protein ACR2PM_09615 [Hyphomicrobiales bacterium]
MDYVKDMALSKREFFRSLKIAMDGADYTVDGDAVQAGTKDQGITISLEPLPERVLSALVKLERWRVTISISGYDEQAETAFMTRFDRAFQRGGG